MARGVKRSIEDRLADLQTKREQKKAELTDIETQIKELEVQKQSELLTKVQKLADEQGMSVDELLSKAVK